MKFVTDLSRGVLGKPDSPVLWNQILSNVPDSLLLKPDFRCLVVACGHCTEAVLLVKRMQSLGIPDSRIQDAIWVLDKYSVFTNQARKYGFKNIITADFLAWDSKGMKFDLVMGNPPFQENTDSDKGNKQGSFWMKFVLKGFSLLKEDGKVIMIHPITWTGIGSYGTKAFKFDLFKQMNPTVLNFASSNHFDVGIGIGYSILNKNVGSETHIETRDESFDINLKDIEVLPFLVSRKNISIVNKIIDKNNGKLYPFSGADGKNCGLKKVYILKARFTNKIYIDETGSTKDTWKCSMPLSDTMIGAHSVFQSKLVNYFFTIMGGKSGLSQTGILQNLPNVDLTRTWTDQELYVHFDLTEEEIEYIDSNIDTQRGRKHAEETER